MLLLNYDSEELNLVQVDTSQMRTEEAKDQNDLVLPIESNEEPPPNSEDVTEAISSAVSLLEATPKILSSHLDSIPDVVKVRFFNELFNAIPRNWRRRLLDSFEQGQFMQILQLIKTNLPLLKMVQLFSHSSTAKDSKPWF